MKITNLLATIVFFVFSAFAHAGAQDILVAKMKWTSFKAVDQADNSVLNYNCTFTTNGGSTLIWDQANGKKVDTYTVVSTSGQWRDILTDGSFTYSVQKGPLTGAVIFSRSNGTVSVRIDFKVNGQQDLNYSFLIDNVTKI